MKSFVVAMAAQGTDKAFAKTRLFQSFGAYILSSLSLKVSGIIFLLFSFLLFEFVFPQPSSALATQSESFSVNPNAVTTTASVFTEKTSRSTQVLAFKSSTVADPTIAPETTKVVQTGVVGQKVLATRVVYHNGQKYSAETTIVSESKPVDEIIAVHPSTFEKVIQTPSGEMKYREKLNVWATSYDPFCSGCSGRTAIGLKAGYGVIAVDPKVIPLRSKVYIPGYGVAIAGDTGGNIKGNKIDLGFDNVKTGNWSARYTDIYILTD